MPVIFGTKTPTAGRPDKDVYVTPLDLAAACVEVIGDVAGAYYDHVLDTGAGPGVWGNAWRDYTNGGRLTGIDLRRLRKPECYDEWIPKTDYLTWDAQGYGASIIMGNPPYSHAEKFIRKSLGLLAFRGVLGYLLPSAFQHGVGRGRGLFKEFPPLLIASLLQRPNFRGMGDSNVNDYILIVWRRDHDKATRHVFLDWKP